VGNRQDTDDAFVEELARRSGGDFDQLRADA